MAQTRETDSHPRDKEICRDFASWLARQHGITSLVEDFEAPDELERNARAADAYFRVGSERYVVEHTSVLTFQGQKHEDCQFRDALWPLNGEPIGPYRLMSHGTAGQYPRRSSAIEAFQGAIRHWVAEVG